MTTPGNVSSDGSSRGEVPVATDGNVMEILRGMMENQQQQTALLREGLLTAPKEQKPGTVSDFRRLQPAVFTGTEKALDAEQWLTDMTDLLKAARIPDENQVEVVKIQLKDVARSWWLAEEATMEQPISWEKFTDAFYERFFPDTAKKEMEEQFIKLQQWDRTVEVYASDFLRLSRFAPYMVADEKNRASRFQQGLRMEIQKFVIPQRLKTYAEVLSVARDMERAIIKENKGKSQAGQKRQNQQQGKGGQPAKRQDYKQLVCNHCGKTGHIIRDCRVRLGLCLACGSAEHQIDKCPKRKPALPAPPVLKALPAPPVRPNPVPAGRGGPLPTQQQAFDRNQQGAGRGRGQAHNLAAEEGEAVGEVVAGKVLILSTPVIALFDSGASHCFISSKIVFNLSLPIVETDKPWEISTGNGVVITNKICKACVIEICGRKLEANFLVLDTGGL